MKNPTKVTSQISYSTLGSKVVQGTPLMYTRPTNYFRTYWILREEQLDNMVKHRYLKYIASFGMIVIGA